MSTMKSQEASSSTSRFTYDVFLSFRGKDTRKSFTDHLYTALDHAGFCAFRDDDEIEIGEDIKFELEKAIRESRISIIVFSKSYASSTWCLKELVMILKRRTFGHVVLPIFYDVDPSEVSKQNGSFEEAFARHEEELKSEKGERKEERIDELNTWRAALRAVAEMVGMKLTDHADGHEARFIQKIIKVVGDKLSRTILDMDPHLVGIHSRVENIQLWLEDGQTNVGIVAICGMGGIGKTTLAKHLYNLNASRFEGSSFLANVREISQQHDGLLRLQKQLLSDILKTKVKPHNTVEGTTKIKDAICCKRVFVVLDDVDERDQLEAIFGRQDWLFSGSKIIITTRLERLIRANEFCKVHMAENLSDEESLELFSWHAFGTCFPNNDYGEVSEQVVSYCGGLPLAVKVLGSSLSGKCLNVWKSQLEKLKAIPHRNILEKLRISYDSLQDDDDKYLFIHLACFFVGSDKDYTITILDGCEFYTGIGIQNLVDRCLISIDERNKLVMHHLLQEMGKEIVHEESPEEPGERRIIWNHKDALNVLRDSSGTSKVEGLKLDRCLMKEKKYAKTVFGDNKKRRYEAEQEKIKKYRNEPLLELQLLANSGYSPKLWQNSGYSPKRYGFNSFSSHLEATGLETSDQVALEANAVGRMNKLKILQLNQVHINGPYERLPKGLRWCCWHEFQLKSIPADFPMESLVALDLRYSNLKNVWVGTKFLELLKILNLSHSPYLAKTPDFSGMPNLERLVLKNCASLVEVHESIGSLERLVLLNLKKCRNLRKLPRSICMLKLLKTLVISGCSNLEELPTNMRNMDSLTSLKADGVSLNQSPSTSREKNAMQFFIRPWLLKPRKSPEISWASLPHSLVDLSLVGCNLSDDVFPRNLSNLCSLKRLFLRRNRFSSLPDFIRGLTGLDFLDLQSCPRLQKVERVPNVNKLIIAVNMSLDEITVRNVHGPKTTCHLDICNHIDITVGIFKIEPIENVSAEITKSLGLSNLPSMGNPIVLLRTEYYGLTPMKLPIQGCHETHTFYVYLPGSKVPPWFIFQNMGSSIYFALPSDRKSRVQGLSVCTVYEHSYGPTKYVPFLDFHTVISNKTKGLIWSHRPTVFGVGEVGGHMMSLSYWKFGNQLDGGDKLSISVFGGTLAKVKEVGVRLVYKEEEEEEMSSRLANEEEQSHQICPFGNIIPGNVLAHPSSPILYQLGRHFADGDCAECRRLYPQPWIPASPYKDWDDTECWASKLLMRRPYYVSEDLG